MLQAKADQFQNRLNEIKSRISDVQWYPYQSMSNTQHLKGLLPDDLVEKLVTGDARQRVLDVGAADGDLGYFFESRGCTVDFLDNPQTNYNDCKGLLSLAPALESRSRLIKQDLDTGFSLDGQYDFAIALGLLYHLRNPMLFLMGLAQHAETMVLSTRVAEYLPDGTSLRSASVAYFLECRESNDDPTNYWCFTAKGLETVLKRSGWRILNKRLIGATKSDPVSASKDQRMFVYCQRVANWRDLGRHHDF